jgi:UDP:flavonoid glycosyltransferase YjiC (YdhE family)
MYLDTPVQVVPVEGHYEQFCNAVDAVRAGAGVRSSGFNIDRLQRALPREETVGERFRAWVRRARHRFAHEIEAVAAKRGEAASGPVSAADPGVLGTA